ncbi:MAG TPA: thiamine pyrophosphate-binding protein, partial [Candidatus Limnocylindrales bacterium]|nr:thiamine pyrophosphate-binding protein [Candidatus Limnocylindrales bacterium]
MSELDAEPQNDETETAAATATSTAEPTSQAAAEPPDPLTEPGFEPPSEPVAEADLQAAPEPDAERAGEPEPEASSEPELVAEPMSEPEPELELVAESEPEPAQEPEPLAEAEPQVDAGPRAVGRFVADALRAAGVRYAFTVPGESFLGLLDALEAAGIRVIATRHEGPASFMAEAHGQLTGRPAVCLGTRAVGGANLAIGIHTARQNSTPMFAAVGQVERAFLGREAFQEIDQVATLGGLAKWAGEPRSIDDVPSIVSEAIRQALGGRPGPALLSIPEDLLDETMPEDARVDSGRTASPRPTDESIRSVIELLASAARPVILAGAGILRARTSTELTRFAELLQVPVIAAWRRPDVISNDHPLYLGMAGLGAPSTVRERLDTADALVVLGCRLNEATSYGYEMPRPGLRWAHVDLEPGRAQGVPAPEILAAADAKAFLRAANERLLGRAVLD